MFNLMVDDLDGALAQVKEGGAELVGEVQAFAYGRFGWFLRSNFGNQPFPDSHPMPWICSAMNS